MNVLRFFLGLAIFTANLAAPIVLAQIPSNVPTPPSMPLPPPVKSPTAEELAVQMAFLDLLPAQRTLICEGFLDAVRTGDKAAAKKFVAPSAYQKLDTQFALMHRLLKDAPQLTQQFAEKAPDLQVGPNDNLWTFGYSAAAGKRWKNAELTMFYLRGQPAEIDGWAIQESSLPLQSQQMRDDAKAMLVFQFIGLNMLLSFCSGVILLLFLAIRSSRRSV